MNPYRDRQGRYTRNPTARAMHFVCWLWQLGEWRLMAAGNDDGPQAA